MMGKIFCGIVVLAVLVLLSPPTQAQEGMLAFVCTDRGHAEVLAGEMTGDSPPLRDARWKSCTPIGQPIGSMADAPAPFMGPLADWEQDVFAVYTDGAAFFIIYWAAGYKPMSAEL